MFGNMKSNSNTGSHMNVLGVGGWENHPAPGRWVIVLNCSCFEAHAWIAG